MNKMFFIIGVLLSTFLPFTVAATPMQEVSEASQWLDNLAPELRVLSALTLLSVAPALLIAMTAFTRIVIVLSLLRQALGLMQTPPNIVIITLAFFLTWFAMEAVIDEAKEQAVMPYINEQISLSTALENGFKPFRLFMISQTKEDAFEAVLAMADAPIPDSAEEVKTVHLIPAFLLSELKTAFQIAFVIFIPFLLIDLVVASTLMALGMIMVPPISIALPIKIMLFVLIDGWSLVTQSLLSSFST